MTEDDKVPEHEAEERFNRLVGNLVNTPHKPHVNAPETKSTGKRDNGGGPSRELPPAAPRRPT
jgi:hypothetical protein